MSLLARKICEELLGTIPTHGQLECVEKVLSSHQYVNGEARWHEWPKEKPPRCDWYLVKDARRKVPTVDHYKDWASSGDEWDGAVTHWHPLPDESCISRGTALTLSRQGERKLKEWIDFITEQGWSKQNKQWLVDFWLEHHDEDGKFKQSFDIGERESHE